MNKELIHAVMFNFYEDKYFLSSGKELLADHGTEIVFVTTNFFKAEQILIEFIEKGER